MKTMNTRIIILLLTGAISLAMSGRAADFDMAAFERATHDLKSYKFGEDKVDLNRIEVLVSVASADTRVRLEVEEKLLTILAEATTYDSRQFICRLLQALGTAKSAGALEPLLTDPEISHMARYALGRIQAPEAGQALHRALGKTHGALQAGIINTLAQRGYRPAAPEIAKLVNSPDQEVTLAAIKALGRFGGKNSVAALKRARSSASESVRIEIDDALLACAETYVAEGKKSQAAEIYRSFYGGNHSVQLRVAGLRGLAAAQGENAGKLLVEAIKGNDPALRQSAIGLLSLMKGKKATNLLVGLLKSLPPDGQELVIRALAERGDATLTPALIQVTGSEHGIVRLAAYEALGEIGNEGAIACLAKAAGTASEQESKIARASLVRMKGPNMDRAFIRAVNTGDSKSREEVIRAIGQRNTCAAFPTLYRVAKTEPEATVRQVAILSAGRVGTASELEQLVDLAVAPKDPGDRSTIEESITIVFTKMDNKDEQARPIIAALKKAPNEAKPVLLGLLSQPATPEASAAVRASLKSTDNLVVDAAIRTLADWPNPEPTDELYEIASTSSNSTHRVLALRGYVRMATLSDESSPIYVKAMKLVRNDNETKMVLGGLGSADTLMALELAEKYMAREELKAEAAQAAVQVAGKYCWQDPTRARATLDRVVAEVQDDQIRKQVRDALNRMNDYKDYILTWKGCGPYTLPNVNDGRQVFETSFEPEKDPDSRNLRWFRVRTVFEGDKRVNLEATFGGIDYCCAYLRTQIWSPVEQQALFRWEADDFIKGWINGELSTGGTLKLRQGNNTFLLKVGDHGGGWNFNCRLLKPDGSSIEGLRCEPN